MGNGMQRRDQQQQQAALPGFERKAAQAGRDDAWAMLKIRETLRRASLLGAEEMRDLARRM